MNFPHLSSWGPQNRAGRPGSFWHRHVRSGPLREHAVGKKTELTCTQTGLQEDYKHGPSPKSVLQPTERSQHKQHCFKESNNICVWQAQNVPHDKLSREIMTKLYHRFNLKLWLDRKVARLRCWNCMSHQHFYSINHYHLTCISSQDEEDAVVGQVRGLPEVSTNHGYVDMLHFFNCFLRFTCLNFILWPYC